MMIKNRPTINQHKKRCKMKSTKNAVVRGSLVAILSVLDCSTQRVEAAVSSGFYQLETVVPEYGAAGVKQIVRIAVTPSGDWKINKQFPTELKIETLSAVPVFNPIQHSKDAAVLRDDRLEFHIAATPAKAGEYALTLVMKFGLCRKGECIWRTERIALRLHAR